MISSLLLIFLSLLFSIVSFRLAQTDLRARLRRCWILFATAGLFNTLGEAIWFYNATIRNTPPFVTLGDVFYVLYYVLLLVGVLLMPYIPLKREERTVLLMDLAIVLTTSLMLFWYFVLFPLSFSPGQDLRVMLATFYPVCGFLVLATLVALLERTVEGVRLKSLLLLTAGMLFTVIADSLFSYLEVNAIIYDEANLNLVYLAGAFFLLLAVTNQLARAGNVEDVSVMVRFNEKTKFVRSALPYISTFSVFVLLAYVLGSAAPRIVGIILGILCLFGLIFVRQYVVLRENIRLYKEMQRIAVTDELTGVSTRRFVRDALAVELIRSQRYDRNLSILLMDLDHFKKYNDTHGHLKGDQVLNRMANIIASQLRATDMVGRFGGDEFLAVLPETDFAGAELVANKIRTAIDSAANSEILIGITIGLATFSSGKSLEQIIEEADRDLYRQKHSRVFKA